jgi:hypothetical protein
MMPQLVKGGKHTYGWSQVGADGTILIPPEAVEEYGFQGVTNLLLVSGSTRSGGFGVSTLEALQQSPMAVILEKNPQLATFELPEGQAVDFNGHTICWVTFHGDGRIRVPLATLEQYGARPGDKLLVIRGSRLGIGFAVRGPIIEEALKHPELAVFQIQ